MIAVLRDADGREWSVWLLSTVLVAELAERGVSEPRVDVTRDAAGKPTSVRVSFGVAPRFEVEASAVGHGLLRDAVRGRLTLGGWRAFAADRRSHIAAGPQTGD